MNLITYSIGSMLVSGSLAARNLMTSKHYSRPDSNKNKPVKEESAPFDNNSTMNSLIKLFDRQL